MNSGWQILFTTGCSSCLALNVMLILYFSPQFGQPPFEMATLISWRKICEAPFSKITSIISAPDKGNGKRLVCISYPFYCIESTKKSHSNECGSNRCFRWAQKKARLERIWLRHFLNGTWDQHERPIRSVSLNAARCLFEYVITSLLELSIFMI